MKRILLAGLIACAILSGCVTKAPKSIIDFTADDKNYKFSLVSDDNFATAVMLDSAGQKRVLQNVPAADGIKMADKNGTSVHFKKGFGILNLNNGADIAVKYSEKK